MGEVLRNFLHFFVKTHTLLMLKVLELTVLQTLLPFPLAVKPICILVLSSSGIVSRSCGLIISFLPFEHSAQ